MASIFGTSERGTAKAGYALADSFLAALAVSMLWQAGAAGVLTGRWGAGWALAGVGSAILVLRLIHAGILTRAKLRGLAILAGLSAAGVVFLVLAYFSLRDEVSGNSDTEAEARRGTGTYRGVILTTEKPLKGVLVAPRLTVAPGREEARDPRDIPFDGVYWYFKFPDREPPKNAYLANGSPARMGFKSGDTMPLQMEAHQTFAQLLDTNCCGRITMTLTNADRQAGIAVELILENQQEAGQKGRGAQTLGRQTVTTRLVRVSDTEFQPSTEVLSFDVPANSRIRQFDAATVKFWRMRRTNGASPRMAIEKFTLVPVGQ